MTNEAGAGPFVLIYRPDWILKLHDGNIPQWCPVIWPWDEPLPEGWKVLPLVQPEFDFENRGTFTRHLQQYRRDRHEPEPGAPADETAGLAAEAQCKDMAYKLLRMLEGMQEHTAPTVLRDAIDVAQRLYRELPEGGGS